jgi:hypothetical protein
MDALTLDVVGVRVGLAASAGVVAALRPLLVDLVDPAPEAEPDVIVPAVRDGADLGGVEDALADVTLAAIEKSQALLLHCGVVVRNGTGVLIPGESRFGKSTLTAACLRRGFDYMTDEMAAIDLAKGTVTGFARPLMLTRWSLHAIGLASDRGPIGKEAILPSRLGAQVVREPVAIGHVVLARRGARASVVRPGDAGAALTATLTAAFNHYAHGVRAWECAARAVSAAQVWNLDVAEPMSAGDVLADAIDHGS